MEITSSKEDLSFDILFRNDKFVVCNVTGKLMIVFSINILFSPNGWT